MNRHSYTNKPVRGVRCYSVSSSMNLPSKVIPWLLDLEPLIQMKERNNHSFQFCVKMLCEVFFGSWFSWQTVQALSIPSVFTQWVFVNCQLFKMSFTVHQSRQNTLC